MRLILTPTIALAAVAVVLTAQLAQSTDARTPQCAECITLADSEGQPQWTPAPYDVEPAIKSAAVSFIEGAGSWSAATPRDDVARLTQLGYPAELASAAAPLLNTPALESATTVLYPQYGGLTPTAASVIVLAEQKLSLPEGPVTRQVTLDVRLRNANGTWAVDARVDPPRPPVPPAQPGGPSTAGATLLGNPNVVLPEPVQGDIDTRRVGDPILRLADTLSRTLPFAVQVAVSGHLGTVFPTTKVSNHAVGRALDIRTIGGRPVAEIPRDDPALTSFMIAARDAGASEVGGPIKLDGPGFFSDSVHQDHIHVGIDNRRM